MSADRYSRRVSPGERGMLVVHQIHPCQIAGVVEGRGQLDPAVLQAAVAEAAVANPGVRVRLKGFLGFSRWVDSGIAPDVRAIAGSDWEGSNERATEFMSQPFDPLGGGAIADVWLVGCGDGRTRIVFRALHAAIDGRGLLHWIREVFRALRGETLQGSDSTLMDIEVQQRYRDKVIPGPKEPPRNWIPVVEPGPVEPLRYIWRRAVIGRPVSNMLTKTVAFLAQRARRRLPDSAVAFTIPVDLRGLRVDEMSVGNLTGYVDLNVGADDTPRSLVQRLADNIRGYADCRVAPAIRLLWWLPIRLLAYRLRRRVNRLLFTANRFLPSGGVVSIGKLMPEWFSCAGFQGRPPYAIPPAVGKLNVIFIASPPEPGTSPPCPSGMR
jgi:hypothetical protein